MLPSRWPLLPPSLHPASPLLYSVLTTSLFYGQGYGARWVVDGSAFIGFVEPPTGMSCGLTNFRCKQINSELWLTTTSKIPLFLMDRGRMAQQVPTLIARHLKLLCNNEDTTATRATFSTFNDKLRGLFYSRSVRSSLRYRRRMAAASTLPAP